MQTPFIIFHRIQIKNSRICSLDAILNIYNSKINTFFNVTFTSSFCFYRKNTKIYIIYIKHWHSTYSYMTINIALILHLCCMSVCLPLQGPVGSLLPQQQVLLGQLQSELRHLQPGLMQLGVGSTLPGAQLPQLPAQALGHMLAGVQTLLQHLDLGLGGLVLHLKNHMGGTEMLRLCSWGDAVKVVLTPTVDNMTSGDLNLLYVFTWLIHSIILWSRKRQQSNHLQGFSFLFIVLHLAGHLLHSFFQPGRQRCVHYIYIFMQTNLQRRKKHSN